MNKKEQRFLAFLFCWAVDSLKTQLINNNEYDVPVRDCTHEELLSEADSLIESFENDGKENQ